MESAAAIPTTRPERILRIGIIGCGEISQVAHIPNINNLSHLFRISYLCDVSKQSLAHCATKVVGHRPCTTTDAAELCSSLDVDVVLIANADAYHVEHGIMALQNDKHCLIEKPVSVCYRDLDMLIEAERQSKGKVFVGTMRRFAPAFLDAVQEVGGMESILYAKFRDFIGPHATFVSQSGTYPQKFNDFNEADSRDRLEREADISEQALAKEIGVPVTPTSKRMLRVLGSLGTHDLSSMREIIGMPKAVLGACPTLPGIFAVLFQYKNFPVVYESGFTNVKQVDAQIEVYSMNKIVRVQFDSPYVKGLPVMLHIKENLGDGGFQERTIRKTYEDSYTLELLEFYNCVVGGLTPKTNALDSREDIELFGMILRACSWRFQGEETA